MAIKWKKYEMYGPEKSGRLKRWFCFLKEKCLSLHGLYMLSVLLLIGFANRFLIWWNYVEPGDTVSLYLYAVLNIALWAYLIRRIDDQSERPFFMQWMKKWPCDLLLLFYLVFLMISLNLMLFYYYELHYSVYDWEGNYVGAYFQQDNFAVIFAPVALVNNALAMILIRHVKTAEMRKTLFVGKIYHKIRAWLRTKNQQYQKKYPFEKKMQLETTILSVILVGMGILALMMMKANGITIGYTLIFIGAVLIFIWLHKHKVFLSDVGILIGEIHDVSEGSTLKGSAISENSVIYDAGEDLTHVYENLNDSVERQVKSEKMKIDLITNVSHDLKTPLTAIIGYIDLLKKTELSDEAKDYVEVLSRKSEHLKDMIQEVFEISKATSGNMELHIETVDMCRLILQTMGDMEDRIEASHRMIRKTLPEEPLYVRSDGQRIYRIYQNLIENALKYSLEGSRIFIDAYGDDRTVTTVIKNTASYEMNFTEESITERFTRGDVNRTTEGNGLGLAIVKSFSEVCGGKFHIHIDGDLFKAIVEFPRYFPEET